ncbi:hypothetical protein B566_EDAN017046 [Ephemera danica]|nr:hypothetical protein B566_EDAN017046 [Ephemera danica]
MNVEEISTLVNNPASVESIKVDTGPALEAHLRRCQSIASCTQSRLRSLGRGEGGEEEGTSGEEQLLGGGWSAEDGAVGGWGAAGSPLTEEIGVNPSDGLVVTPTLCPSVPCHCDVRVNGQLQCHCSCGESGCFLSSPTSGAGEVEDSSSEDGLQYYEPAWDVLLPPTAEDSTSDTASQNSTITAEQKPERIEEEEEEETCDENARLIGHRSDNDDQERYPENVERYPENLEACPESQEEVQNTDAESQIEKGICESDNERLDNDLSASNGYEELVNDVDDGEEEKQKGDTDSEIRECVEKLCNEIISQAEVEVAAINSNDSSPKVVISRVESVEVEEVETCEEDHPHTEDEPYHDDEHMLKDKEEINTLFHTLNVKEQSTSGSSSQISTPDDERPRRVQRSSSLKSGKTPPSTPGRKKIVRFADVLGLDLADVRTFLDEVPKVPSCAFWDLEVEKRQEIALLAPAKCLVPMFQQPVSSPDFLEKVRCNKVCLENAFQGDSLSISGVIRVLNVDFHKSVYLRYSLDCWENFADLQCSYVQGSSDGFSDKFSFVLYSHTLDVGQRVEFAIRYQTAGQLFWDSNGGVNYSFQCLNSTISTVQCGSEFSVHPSNESPDSDGWASFY